MRHLLEGSQFLRKHDPKRVQDAYSLRCIPQIHGSVREAIAYAKWLLAIELNSATDNPLIFVDDETGQIDVISGGNFHGEPVALAMDYLTMALVELANVSERRVNRLVDAKENEGILPPFLTEGGGLNSGFMIAHYTAASLVSGNRSGHEALSDREFEVLRLLVEGLGPTEIGERLHLSVKTVSTHKTRILEKLGLGSTAELVRYALEHKLFG